MEQQKGQIRGRVVVATEDFLFGCLSVGEFPTPTIYNGYR